MLSANIPAYNELNLDIGVFMPNGKLDNELNLALEIPEAARDKALNLNVGYSPATICGS
jgi:hypothetical protein